MHISNMMDFKCVKEDPGSAVFLRKRHVTRVCRARCYTSMPQCTGLNKLVCAWPRADPPRQASVVANVPALSIFSGGVI